MKKAEVVTYFSTQCAAVIAQFSLRRAAPHLCKNAPFLHCLNDTIQGHWPNDDCFPPTILATRLFNTWDELTSSDWETKVELPDWTFGWPQTRRASSTKLRNICALAGASDDCSERCDDEDVDDEDVDDESLEGAAVDGKRTIFDWVDEFVWFFLDWFAKFVCISWYWKAGALLLDTIGFKCDKPFVCKPWDGFIALAR